MTLPIANNDIESELSYAYLHAVASAAGASCTYSTRLSDNRGIDAQLTAWGPFINGGERTEVDLKIQLKATTSTPSDTGSHLSFSLKDIAHYDDLRRKGAYAVPRVLVVLYLPKNKAEWISSTSDVLSLRKSAYWVNLAGAKESNNKNSVTVYLPKSQLLTSDALREVFAMLSQGDLPDYSAPGEAG